VTRRAIDKLKANRRLWAALPRVVAALVIVSRGGRISTIGRPEPRRGREKGGR
jgi:hypothetical protein